MLHRQRWVRLVCSAVWRGCWIAEDPGLSTRLRVVSVV